MTTSRAVSPEQTAREEELIHRVVRSLDTCENPRLKELLVTLVEQARRSGARRSAS